jgi:hypothetical protein
MTKTTGEEREVECLACGARRRVAGLSHGEVGECPSCGYCGWAEPADLTNPERDSLHRELYVRREFYKRSVLSPPDGALTVPRVRGPIG